MTTADAACPSATQTVAFTGVRRIAQTFVALRGGQLTSASVGMSINTEGATFALEIRDVDAAEKPGSAVLASTTVANVPKTSFDGPVRTVTGAFSAPATVVAGQRYALVVSEPSELGYAIQVNTFTNPCADGSFFIDSFGDGDFRLRANDDLVFATFVTA